MGFALWGYYIPEEQIMMIFFGLVWFGFLLLFLACEDTFYAH